MSHIGHFLHPSIFHPFILISLLSLSCHTFSLVFLLDFDEYKFRRIIFDKIQTFLKNSRPIVITINRTKKVRSYNDKTLKVTSTKMRLYHLSFKLETTNTLTKIRKESLRSFIFCLQHIQLKLAHRPKWEKKVSGIKVENRNIRLTRDEQISDLWRVLIVYPEIVYQLLTDAQLNKIESWKSYLPPENEKNLWKKQMKIVAWLKRIYQQAISNVLRMKNRKFERHTWPRCWLRQSSGLWRNQHHEFQENKSRSRTDHLSFI